MKKTTKEEILSLVVCSVSNLLDKWTKNLSRFFIRHTLICPSYDNNLAPVLCSLGLSGVYDNLFKKLARNFGIELADLFKNGDKPLIITNCVIPVHLHFIVQYLAVSEIVILDCSKWIIFKFFHKKRCVLCLFRERI